MIFKNELYKVMQCVFKPVKLFSGIKKLKKHNTFFNRALSSLNDTHFWGIVMNRKIIITKIYILFIQIDIAINRHFADTSKVTTV